MRPTSLGYAIRLRRPNSQPVIAVGLLYSCLRVYSSPLQLPGVRLTPHAYFSSPAKHGSDTTLNKRTFCHYTYFLSSYLYKYLLMIGMSTEQWLTGRASPGRRGIWLHSHSVIPPANIAWVMAQRYLRIHRLDYGHSKWNN